MKNLYWPILKGRLMIMDCFFNVGYAFHANQTVDDRGYIRELVTALQGVSVGTDMSSYSLSNGGDMSYYLACEASDLFRAVRL